MTNLLGNEGQQSDLTGTLDGLGQLTLMHSACLLYTSDAADE